MSYYYMYHSVNFKIVTMAYLILWTNNAHLHLFKNKG